MLDLLSNLEQTREKKFNLKRIVIVIFDALIELFTMKKIPHYAIIHFSFAQDVPGRGGRQIE